jgi:hypothetical protein
MIGPGRVAINNSLTNALDKRSVAFIMPESSLLFTCLGAPGWVDLLGGQYECSGNL